MFTCPRCRKAVSTGASDCANCKLEFGVTEDPVRKVSAGPIAIYVGVFMIGMGLLFVWSMSAIGLLLAPFAFWQGVRMMMDQPEDSTALEDRASYRIARIWG